MLTEKRIEIDGSFGEGGGQIIRSSLSLSAITQQSFHIFNIRPHRLPKPRLRPQHFMAAKAIAEITHGTLSGAEIGATAFMFSPGKITAGHYEFDIGTAGSCILIAQTIIPVLLMAKESSTVKLIGGTHLPKSPCYDYFYHVFLKALKKFNIHIESKLQRSGYFPRGNGVVELKIHPTELHGCQSWSGDSDIQAVIRLSRLPSHIMQREKQILLANQISNIETCEDESDSPGNIITLWHDYCGVSALGVPGLPAEQVANNAVYALRSEIGEVDHHLADQLLLYAALAKEETRYQTSLLSEHLRTNAYIIQKFLSREIILNQQQIQVRASSHT